MNRYYVFQMVNIYATIFSSSLIQTLRQIINYPSCAFEILGQSVPAVAPYFIQMIVIKVRALRLSDAPPWRLSRLAGWLAIIGIAWPATRAVARDGGRQSDARSPHRGQGAQNQATTAAAAV
jgi:hypothetical protein